MTTNVNLGTIRPSPGGAVRPRKRRGKGAGTGLGGTSGKGHKGHKARTGGKIPVWFEGGQMPIQRRLPKRGFKNPGRVEYQVVSVERLAKVAANTIVDSAWLRSNGWVRRPGPIKMLGTGTPSAGITVRVDAASVTARKAIEAAGGKLELPQREANP